MEAHMTDNRKISLCITNFDRFAMTLDSFREVVDDQRINEIVISDDRSQGVIYYGLESYVKRWDKVKIWRNEKNLGCYRNKREAISKSSNEFVIIFDSDNILTTEYLD